MNAGIRKMSIVFHSVKENISIEFQRSVCIQCLFIEFKDAEIIKMFERKLKFSLVRKSAQTKWTTHVTIYVIN